MKKSWLRHLIALSLLSRVILSLSTISGLVQAQEPGWSDPVSLSRGLPQSYLPDIAADRAGNLYVVWEGRFEERVGTWSDGIFFSMWDGNSWSPAIDILGSNMNHLPAIAVDSQGRLHLVGVGDVGLGYSRAWAQQRPSDAQAWSDPFDISDRYPRVYWNDIVVDDHDWIHVVFSDSAPPPNPPREVVGGQCEGKDCSWVFYTRSTDGGDSWSAPVAISPAMVSGGRVMITLDRHGNLYVVWSTEYYWRDDIFVPSANGFAYSVDRGTSWSEAEMQIFDTSGTPWEVDNLRDYWLSIAVDSQQTIHIVTAGGGMRHLYKEGLNGPWIEDTPPSFNIEGLGGNYGFRGMAVDSSDNLHFILPTIQFEDSEVPPGLFHAVWSRESGWSAWTRATTNTRGKGCGLGNLAISRGNRLSVAWFEHLERSSGYLFREPRGRIEIYCASFQSGAQSIPLVPLPPMPTPTAIVPTAQLISTLEPTLTDTPTATPWSPGSSDAGNARTTVQWSPDPLLVGPALAGALVVVVVILKSTTIGRR